jgi:hypothetical protein
MTETRRSPENYYFENNEWWYAGAKSRRDGERQRAETHHKKNKNRMWVNGKYIPKSHPLHKPGRYKTFEDAGFSILAKYETSVEGQVYIITNPNFAGWVKVGMAIDSEDRLNGYQTSSPFRDYFLHSFWAVSDRRQAEATAHAELEKTYERKGEWFKCTPEQAKEVISGIAEEYK